MLICSLHFIRWLFFASLQAKIFSTFALILLFWFARRFCSWFGLFRFCFVSLQRWFGSYLFMSFFKLLNQMFIIDDFCILRFVHGAVIHWDTSLDKGATSNMEFHFKVVVIWSNKVQIHEYIIIVSNLCITWILQ